MISRLQSNQISLKSSRYTLRPGGEPNGQTYGYGKLQIDEHLVLSASRYHAIYPGRVSALSCLCIMKQGTDQDWQCVIGILDLLIAAGAKLNLVAGLHVQVAAAQEKEEYWNVSPFL